MRRNLAIAVLGAAALLGVSACGSGQYGPDPTENATHLTTYKVEGLPNVTTFCLGDLGYAMSATGDNTGADEISLTRVYEKDTECLNNDG